MEKHVLRTEMLRDQNRTSIKQREREETKVVGQKLNEQSSCIKLPSLAVVILK